MARLDSDVWFFVYFGVIAAFVLLKVFRVVGWDWWVVLIPVWIPVVGFALLCMMTMVILVVMFLVCLWNGIIYR